MRLLGIIALLILWFSDEARGQVRVVDVSCSDFTCPSVSQITRIARRAWPRAELVVRQRPAYPWDYLDMHEEILGHWSRRFKCEVRRRRLHFFLPPLLDPDDGFRPKYVFGRIGRCSYSSIPYPPLDATKIRFAVSLMRASNF